MPAMVAGILPASTKYQHGSSFFRKGVELNSSAILTTLTINMAPIVPSLVELTSVTVAPCEELPCLG